METPCRAAKRVRPDEDTDTEEPTAATPRQQVALAEAKLRLADAERAKCEAEAKQAAAACDALGKRLDAREAHFAYQMLCVDEERKAHARDRKALAETVAERDELVAKLIGRDAELDEARSELEGARREAREARTRAATSGVLRSAAIRRAVELARERRELSDELERCRARLREAGDPGPHAWHGQFLAEQAAHNETRTAAAKMHAERGELELELASLRRRRETRANVVDSLRRILENVDTQEDALASLHGLLENLEAEPGRDAEPVAPREAGNAKEREGEENGEEEEGGAVGREEEEESAAESGMDADGDGTDDDEDEDEEEEEKQQEEEEDDEDAVAPGRRPVKLLSNAKGQNRHTPVTPAYDDLLTWATRACVDGFERADERDPHALSIHRMPAFLVAHAMIEPPADLVVLGHREAGLKAFSERLRARLRDEHGMTPRSHWRLRPDGSLATWLRERYGGALLPADVAEQYEARLKVLKATHGNSRASVGCSRTSIRRRKKTKKAMMSR